MSNENSNGNAYDYFFILCNNKTVLSAIKTTAFFRVVMVIVRVMMISSLDRYYCQ